MQSSHHYDHFAYKQHIRASRALQTIYIAINSQQLFDSSLDQTTFNFSTAVSSQQLFNSSQLNQMQGLVQTCYVEDGVHNIHR
jgi:hypothetical protein